MPRRGFKGHEVALRGCPHEPKRLAAIGADSEVSGLDVELVDILEDHGPPWMDSNAPAALVYDADTDMLDVAGVLVYLVEQSVEGGQRGIDVISSIAM